MSTVKDKMIEELAIYVATVRDGGDVGLDDEQMAAKAFGILSEAAESNMEGGDFGVLSDLLTMDVEEFDRGHVGRTSAQRQRRSPSAGG